jgi:hypothetical protein
LKAYNLIDDDDECSSTWKYQLTDNGSQACKDIFINVVKINKLKHHQVVPL